MFDVKKMFISTRSSVLVMFKYNFCNAVGCTVSMAH